MKTSILKSLATATVAALGSLGAQAREVGESAPLFEAASTDGNVRLADYLGKRHVVLAFYLADFTPT